MNEAACRKMTESCIQTARGRRSNCGDQRAFEIMIGECPDRIAGVGNGRRRLCAGEI
jgi:hypothetical protein